MKRAYTIIALALCNMIFASNIVAQESGNKEEKGFFIGIEGGAATGVSTFKSDKPSLQMNLGGGYRFNKWFSLELDLGGGRFGIIPQSCCSAHSGINNERNSYWRSFVDDEWHYYADNTTDGWWYADMNGTTSYIKGAMQANFDVFSFFTDKVGLDLSPRIGAMSTRTELSGKSSLTGNELSLKNDARVHLLYGGETTLSYKFDNGIRLGAFAALDMLAGKHFDNIPVHVHKENLIWDAGIKLVYAFGRKHKKNATAAPVAAAPVAKPAPVAEPAPASVAEPSPEPTPAPDAIATPAPVQETVPVQEAVPAPAPTIPAFAPVYFENNSAVVSAIHKEHLLDVVRFMKQNPDVRILVSGHASNIGTAEYNLILSEKRSNAVKQFIESEGVGEGRIEIEPCGIDYSALSAGEARRADVVVIEIK